jgi:ABC-type sugar transport system substrate-binding protein
MRKAWCLVAAALSIAMAPAADAAESVKIGVIYPLRRAPANRRKTP